jgi:hypothetical protein
MNIPGFTAERSLVRSSDQYVTFDRREGDSAIMPAVPGHPGSTAVIMQAGPTLGFGSSPNGTAAPTVAAESVPGGPSTVPSGYGRTCKRVPYWVCDANGCRTEYGWVCTYYPLPRMM